MTMDEIAQAHLAYWKHSNGCLYPFDPMAPSDRDCPDHRKLYDAWRAGLMGCWGVYVNDASIYGTGQGKEWWTDFLRYRMSHRITALSTSEWFVMCDSEQEACSLASAMVGDYGIPASAVKVKQYGQCQHLVKGGS